jgi:hypothetical protein
MEGSSVGEYQRKMRITAACRMMQSSTLPLAQIAAETGFADQAHFSRVFKRQTGKTPREYRSAITARTSLETQQLGFDPVGSYPFHSQTADGRPYDGEIEITSSATGYTGIVRTSVMPDVSIDTIAVKGRRMVITGSVPAGTAIVDLSFDGRRFTGGWRVAGKRTAIHGRKA